jgi:MOSC domain-containing protein YiiM
MGVVLAIHLSPGAAETMLSVPEAHAVPGKGLEGDRYFKGTGTYSGKLGLGREVTLIEVEALEALAREHGIELTAGETRRNILTQGISLNDCVGKTLKVGGVVLEGIRLCEPCRHLAQLTGKSLVKPLTGRGGLRTRIVTGGVIRAGDPILV